MRLLTLAVLTALAPLAVTHAAQGHKVPDFNDPEVLAVNDQLIERLSTSQSPNEQAFALARIVILERPGGLLQEVAEHRLRESIGLARGPLFSAFREGDDEAKITVLGYYIEYYPSALGQLTDPTLFQMIQDGLESKNAKVRQAAAAVVALWPVNGRIANLVIDAAEADSSLTVAALRAIETAGDELGARWVAEKVTSEDPVVRGAALRAANRIDRRASFFLRNMAESKDGDRRRAGVEGLLAIGNAEDLSFLHAWLESHGGTDPELAGRVIKAVSEIEIGTYVPQLPPKAPVPIPEGVIVPF